MKIILIIIISLTTMINAKKRVNFDDYFIDKTMRIDYFHIGDVSTEIITIDKIYQQGIWAGSINNLIDDLNNGRYYYKIYDTKSGELIFSKGFDSYFGEYKTSDDALKNIKRTYHESAMIPYPKNSIQFAFERRNRNNTVEEIFRYEIDPGNLTIIKKKIIDGSVKIFEPVENGDPHTRVDIVILGEGYSTSEESKFKSDLDRFTKLHFSFEPYKSLKNKFNIWGVFKPSEESGIDEPDHASFKNSALNCTYYSLGSERYILTEDNKVMRDLAAHVPYDAIYIMINHKRYGGGGIYNLFCTFITDNQWSEYIFLHEFGHSFAGLADEYYTSETAYNDFYPKGIEPVEPNITALLSPGGLKWSNLASPGIEIPTPWEKEEYDSADIEYQKIRRTLNNKVAELKRNGSLKKDIEKLEAESEKVSKDRAMEADDYISKSKFVGKVGAFEGAGYSSKGLYRSELDCLMFSKGNKPFCSACEQALLKVIEHYTK